MIAEGLGAVVGVDGGGEETSIEGLDAVRTDGIGGRGVSVPAGPEVGDCGTLWRLSETSARGRSGSRTDIRARFRPPPFFFGGVLANVEVGRLPGSGGRVPPCPWVAFQTAMESA